MSFLDDAFESGFQKGRRVLPQHTNRASQSGWVCKRRLQWTRTRWREASLPDTGLERLFAMGRVLEPVILRRLEDSGLTITQSQRDLSWPEFQLTGHIDGIVSVPDTPEEAILEIKSCSRFSYDKLKKAGRTAAEIMKIGGYLAGYVSQLGLYCLLMGKQRGFLFFVEKDTLRSHTVEVNLNDTAVLNAAEAALSRFEAVNKAIAEGIDLPAEPADYCDRCPFAAACQPDRDWTQSIAMMDNNEIEGALERRDELKVLASELKEIEDDLSTVFKDPGQTLIGNWLVTVKTQKRVSLDPEAIPEEIREAAKKETTFVRRNYARVQTPATVTTKEAADESSVPAGGQGAPVPEREGGQEGHQVS